jgi:hypothetical protein
MGFNIIEGDVNVKSAVVSATDTLSGIDNLGATSTIDIGSAKGKLLSLLCIHTVGAGTLFTVSVYDNSSTVDQNLIYEAETTVITNKIQLNTEEMVFNNSSNTNLYVKVTPATGSGHSFFIRIQAEKSN